MTTRVRLLCPALLLLAAAPAPPTRAAGGAWAAYKLVAGEWKAEGGGAPGQGAGGFSFAPDLQERVLVRHASTDYLASANNPASKHDDLMIVYREQGAPSDRAIYFDNEGHVIRYAVTPA